MYSKTSSTNCSSSAPLVLLSFCLHQPPLAMVLSSPQLKLCSRTGVSLCGLDASPFPLCFFPGFLFALISFPQSDRSVAVGSLRGWEIPTASSHCMTRHSKTPELQLSAHRENQDHLVTKLEPARPKTLSLLSPLRGGGGEDAWGAPSWQLCVCVIRLFEA